MFIDFAVFYNLIKSLSQNFRNLPPQFPQDKPCIKVQPPVRHPWVDSNSKVVGCPNLNNVCKTYFYLLTVEAFIEC